jgi:hypothetical protein
MKNIYYLLAYTVMSGSFIIVQAQEDEKKIERWGVGLQFAGGTGVIGIRLFNNVNESWSLALGVGRTTAEGFATFGGYTNNWKSTEWSLVGLSRYYLSKSFFLLSGLSTKFKSVEATSGSGTFVSDNLRGLGVPIAIGFESRGRNGFFFNAEAGFGIYFSGTEEKTLIAGTYRETFDGYPSGIWYGVGMGWYFDL